MRCLELVDLPAHVDGGAVALEPLLGLVALGDQPLGEARLLEHGPLLGQVRLRSGAVVARLGERVAVPLQLRERRLAVALRGGRLGEVRLGGLDPAGVLVALGVQVVDRALELLARPARPAIRAGDGRLEAIPEGRLVARRPSSSW